jgi:hypothetical protein
MNYGNILLTIWMGFQRLFMKLHVSVLFSIIFSGILLCQENSLNGRVFDRSTKEILNSVYIYDRSTNKGTITDETGTFNLSLTEGDHNLVFSYLGFQTIDTIFRLSEDTEVFIYMTPINVSLGEVTVAGDYFPDQVTSSQMGSFAFTRKEILKIPTLLGETDPLRLLQLTPGVQSGAEGNLGFYVRGGSTDQNLILYDKTLVYNPGHLLGFFSVFNPDIIKDVNIIKSGIPARYGGKLSSVIQLKSYKGNKDSVEFISSIGLVSTRMTVSGPLLKKRGTFILGARQTYLELFVAPVVSKYVKNKTFFNRNNIYNFYDYNGSINLKISENDQLTISGYSGRDGYKMTQEGIKQNNALRWGNTTASVSWEHKFNDLNSWNTTLSRTNYVFDLSGSQSDYFFNLYSSVKDYNLRSEISQVKNKHRITSGFELTEHNFIPNEIDARAGNFNLNFGQFNELNALEGGLFVDDEFPLTARISFAAGLRFSFFNHHGPYKEFIRNSLDQITDTIRHPRNKSLAFYYNPEPRIVINYLINDGASVKASYMRIAQYVHLATSATVSLPTDIWIPSTSGIKPLIGDQVSIGFFKNLYQNEYEFSTELYYREMINKLEFLRGIIFNSVYGNTEENITAGMGRSYGVEFFLRKKRGDLTWWLSYSLARTEQRFDKINNGLFYPAKYDRRHDISFTAVKKLNTKWTASAVFIFNTGNAFTVPVGRYIIQGNIVNQYGGVNMFRMPPYHRLDLSVSRQITVRRKWKSEMNFSVYNVYNRANPYFVYFEATGDLETYSLQIKEVEVNLFPVIPSVSLNLFF